MESTLGYSEYDEAWFTEPTDSLAGYYERLQNNVELALKPLEPYLAELESINSYSDLLLVDNELLTLMEAFEMARVELNEGYDEGVLARTGGHHKDYLDLYQDALRGRDTPRNGCICLSGDSFDIPPIQIISAYLHDKKKMPSL
jgi:hypothetical protein